MCRLGLALLFLPLGGVEIGGHFVTLTEVSMRCGPGSMPDSTSSCGLHMLIRYSAPRGF